MMSHYTVAVLTKEEPSEEIIEKILAPYDENLEVKTIITKDELIKKIRQEIEEYKNGTYALFLSNKDDYKKNCVNEAHITYLEKEFPEKLKWNDEQCYKSALVDYNEEDILPNGNVVCHYNPKSKWDWYTIGGRWDGMLQTVIAETKEIKNVNSCKLKNLVFTDLDKQKERLGRYWELKIENAKPTEQETKDMKFDLYNKEYYIDNYKDKEHYILFNSILQVYAYVDEHGEWHEPGAMGWFGCADTNYEKNLKYYEDFKKNVLNNPNQELYITIVDCHI